MATFTGTTGADVADAGTGTITGFTGGTVPELQDATGDSITGGDGNDSIVAGGGNDTIVGGIGNDSIDAGGGDDLIIIGFGEAGSAETIIGGSGNDTISITSSTSSDVYRATISGVEAISFNGTNSTVVWLDDSHVGTGNIATITGDAFANFVSIRTFSGVVSVDLSAVTFLSWSTNDNVEVIGSSGNDAIVGSDKADVIFGDAGADNMTGGAGNDTFSFNGGHVSSGEIIAGGGDTDRLLVFGNNDFTLSTLTSIERIDFGNAASTINFNSAQLGGGGLSSAAVISSGSAANTIQITVSGNTPINLSGWTFGTWTGGTDQIQLFGGSGDDVLTGTSAADSIDGGSGNDTIDGGLGNDTLLGGADDDTIISTSGVDSIDGGTGNDVLTLNRASATANLTFNLTNIAATTTLVGDGTTVINVETFAITGGSGNESFTTLGGNDTLDGGDGNDTLNGGNGNDSLLGGVGQDNLTGGIGDDTIALGDNAELGREYAYGGTGNDSMTAGVGQSQLSGEDGDDVLTYTGGGTNSGNQFWAYGGANNDSITGGDGNDWLQGDAGNDTLIGGGGNDTIFGGTGSDSLSGGTGDDQLTSNDSSGADIIDGGADFDTLALDRSGSALATNADFSNSAGQQTLGDGTTVVNVERISFYSGAGDDTITSSNDAGGAGYNYVSGGAGNDSLTAASTGATLFGDAGNDTLTGSDATDALNGGADNDTIALGANSGVGREYAYGGTGNDSMTAGVGQSQLSGEDGDDVLTYTGVGNNAGKQFWAYGGNQNDSITGGDGNDWLQGDAGNDTLIGGGGNDTIFGGTGSDSLSGGTGDDQLTSNDSSGADIIDGGADFDALALDRSGSALANTTDLSDAAVLATLGDGTTVVNVERITFTSGSGDDTITSSNDTAGAGYNSVSGGAGNDSLTAASNGATLVGDAGNDTLTGSGATDALNGGADNDTIALGANSGISREYGYGGTGNDTMTAGVGQSQLSGEDGDDVLSFAGVGNNAGKQFWAYGGANNDSITGSDGNDYLSGDAGEDTIAGGLGNDSLLGGDGNDLISDTGGTDSIDGGLNTDRLVLDRSSATANLTFTMTNTTSTTTLVGDGTTVVNVETIYLTGGSGNDSFTAYTGNDSLSGGAGNDTLNGGAGNDTVLGGAGNDSLTGGAGADSLDGGEDSDTYVFNTGDVAAGETIADTGATGTDTIRLLSSTDFSSAGAITGMEALAFTAAGQTATFNASQFPAALAVTGVTGTETIQINMGSSTALSLTQLNYTVTGGTVVLNWSGDADGETMAGWDFVDVMSSGGGNDTLQGRNGNDTLDGGDGDDSVNGGQGNDLLTGGTGNDTVRGGQQTDTAVFSGDRATYTIERIEGATLTWRVIDTDTVTNGNDGTDLVQEVETLSFGAGSPSSLSIASLIGALSDSNATANSLAEDASISAVVGITALAADGNAEAVTYTLSNDAGGRFAIDANTGVVTLAAALDFETATSHAITVRATSADGSFTEAAFTVNVTNVAPSAPADAEGAAGGSIAEDAANGAAVGITAAAADPNGGAVTFTLSNDAGGRFTIDSGTGVVTVANAALINFEDNASHDITVRAADASGAFTETTLTVAVGNVAPSAPADMDGVSGGSIAEDVATGAAVGITAVSTDVHGGAITYTLFDDAGGRFAIDSVTGIVTVANAALINFEDNASHDITVRASDAAGLFADTGFAIAVTDVNDAPTGAPTAILSEGTEDETYVVDASDLLMGFSDADGDTLSIENLISSSGTVTDNGNGTFTISAPANVNGVVTLTYDVTDGNGGTLTGQTQTFTRAPVDDAPDDIALAGTSVQEFGANGTVVGTLSATDPDGAETFTYTLINNAGGRFSIVGNQLRVANGILIDFEQAASHDVVIKVSDSTGETRTETFTITVSDVNPETLTGDGLANAIVGGALADSISGAGGNDSLSGGGGDDTLDGGTGNDTLAGGAGNDTYIVNVANDVITETAGNGTADRVRTGTSYVLASTANIEFLETTNAAATFALNLTGNSLANNITANAGINTIDGGTGADTMVGGAGNDTYIVDRLQDVVTELAGGGTDTVRAAASGYILGAEIENLVLTGAAAMGTGNSLNNTITGNDLANTLNGGTGVDTLIGGLGNDTYIVDAATDVVTEAAGNGTADRVKASVSYTLASNANIEFLETTNAALTTAINLTGNALNNTITGNAGANTLLGGSGNDGLAGGAGNDILGGGAGNDSLVGGTGNDTLDGDAGNDTLDGGAGADVFVFNDALNATTNLDHITLFDHTADTMHIDNAVFAAFAAVAANTVLTAGAFMANTTGLATETDDRIIYNTATGDLFYDSNGSTAGGTIVRFAILDNKPANLAFDDFIIV